MIFGHLLDIAVVEGALLAMGWQGRSAVFHLLRPLPSHKWQGLVQTKSLFRLSLAVA